MNKTFTEVYKQKIKYGATALAVVAFAVFVILPLMPQVSSTKSDIGFSAHIIKADTDGNDVGAGDMGDGVDAGNGDANDNGSGSLGNDNGSGCCDAPGMGDGEDAGNGDDANDSPSDPGPSNDDPNPSGGDNQPQPPVIDVCPNITGAQESIPTGMVMDGGNCVTPTPVVWTPYCTGANDPNGNTWQWWEESNTTPKQYRFVRNGDGTCMPTIVPDVCPNIAGVQATIPAGMVKNAAGNCVTPDNPISGTISVTPGSCVSTTERAVTVNWSTQNAQNIVAQASGGTYGSGQNISTVSPTPTGSVTLNLTAGGYAFSVSGHDGSAWATLNNTSIIVDTSACTAIPDVCPNIAGNQAVVPAGMIKDTAGNCVTPSPNDLVCDISITPGTVNRGDSATMRWDTTNATSVSITDISSPGLDGSQTITVNENKTYTLTATRGAETKTCTASVTVNTGGGGGGGGGGGSSGPRCSAFTASDKSIQSGESVKLSWRTVRGTKVMIEPDVFDSKESKEVKEGSIIVKPTKDTTYKLTVSRGSRKDTCTTEVRVDDITTITTRDQATLSFSDMPYTGFDAGPFLTSVFYTLLALWSAAVAYVLVIKKGTVFGFGLFATAGGHDGHGHGGHGHAAHGSGALMPHRELSHGKDTHGPDSPIMHASHIPAAQHVVASVAAPAVHAAHAEAPLNLPTAHDVAPAWATIPGSHAEETSEKDIIAELEGDAHMHNVLLSSDALRAIVDRGETTPKSKEILNDVITRAKASYPREDGWIILNRERVNALFVETKASVDPETPVVRVEGGSTLAEALVTGNTTLAYQKLGAQPLFALADAAEDLDNVLRARRGGGASSDFLLHAAGSVSDEKLKAAVVALTTAIDGTYDDEAAAVRLAIIKALKTLA